MKRFLEFVLIGTIVFFMTDIAMADMYKNTDAYSSDDVLLDGIQASGVSDVSTGANNAGWETDWKVTDETSLWTAWSGTWLEFTASLTTGVWNIGVNATNATNTLPSGYVEFKVTSSMTDESFTIVASTSEIYSGFFTYTISQAGDYTVKYTWVNDQCNSTGDANIQIVSAFFDKIAAVPEPTTMLLFGTGLAGLAAVGRRKK